MTEKLGASSVAEPPQVLAICRDPSSEAGLASLYRILSMLLACVRTILSHLSNHRFTFIARLPLDHFVVIEIILHGALKLNATGY